MANPENYQENYYDTQSDAKNSEHFVIEDLLDFPNDDGMVTADGTFDTTAMIASGGNSTDSSNVTVVDASCISSFTNIVGPEFGVDTGCRNVTTDGGQFASELFVPYDELAELEWLSTFVEESLFSSEEFQKLQLISGKKAPTDEASTTINNQFQSEANRVNSAPAFRPKRAVPAKARSKRSRIAANNWTSRIFVVSPDTNNAMSTVVTPPTMSSSSESDIVGKKTVKGTIKKKEPFDDVGMGSGGDGRKCLHCATDKTPQWRTGPMGPKTLCNACGVRYKSGRLVPEYRPAASPTFMLTKHSNSHRKVLEIRRQKEMSMAQQHQQQLIQQSMVFDVSNNEDYLIHQHIGPDFRQLI